MPKDVAEAKLAATGSAVPSGGPYPKLPPNFQKGVAISVFQNSGGLNSNWGRYAEARGKLFGLVPNIMDKSTPNDGGCDFWDRCAATQLNVVGCAICVQSLRQLAPSEAS